MIGLKNLPLRGNCAVGRFFATVLISLVLSMDLGSDKTQTVLSKRLCGMVCRGDLIHEVLGERFPIAAFYYFAFCAEVIQNV
jgi:hypothetical protein